MAQYLDKDGLSHLLTLLKGYFVKQEAGKGLSENDYTTDEKTKLASLENYELPKATDAVLGGVIIGDGLEVTPAGVLSAKIQEGTKNYNDLYENTLPTINNHTIKGAVTLANIGAEASANKASSIDTSTTKYPTNNAVKTFVEGKGYLTEHQDISGKEDTSNKVNAVSADSTETQYASAKAVWDAVSDVVEIAQGKTASYVFATEADLDAELAKSEFVSKLKIGDVFLIVAIDVPDYWWTGTAKAKLETTKVDVSRITESEITELLGA